MMIRAEASDVNTCSLRHSSRSVPVITAARRVQTDDNFVSFVNASDTALARMSATWLAEHLGGKGKNVLLPGLAGASPAEMRLQAAKEVFGQFPGIQIFDTQYTGWSPANGKTLMSAIIQRSGKEISGVWADSGLQGSGSVEAFLNAGFKSNEVPPHTGGGRTLQDRHRQGQGAALFHNAENSL